jgi:hypothetical protein
MPTVDDFQAMDAQQFESFWTMYSACHRAFSPVDLKRSIALKHAGWLPLGNFRNAHYAALLWTWYWQPPGESVRKQMMHAYREMMKAKTGVDPDDPHCGTDKIRTLGESCPTAFDPAIKKA